VSIQGDYIISQSLTALRKSLEDKSCSQWKISLSRAREIQERIQDFALSLHCIIPDNALKN